MIQIKNVNIADITLCPANAEIFPDSTSDEEIAKLAEDIKARGQQYPIQVCHTTHPTTGESCLMAVDGHRRIMALDRLGREKVLAIDVGEMTYDEVISTIIDSSTSSRTLSPREQYNLFRTAKDLLQKEHGRGVGRPSKEAEEIIDLNEINYLELKTLAAKKAGISRGTADRLEKVFEQASTDIVAKVVSGELSIHGAYQMLPKRPKKTQVEATKEAPIEETDTKEEVEEREPRNVADNPFEEDEPDPQVQDNEDDAQQVVDAPVEAKEPASDDPKVEESPEEEEEDEVTFEGVIAMIEAWEEPKEIVALLCQHYGVVTPLVVDLDSADMEDGQKLKVGLRKKFEQRWEKVVLALMVHCDHAERKI